MNLPNQLQGKKIRYSWVAGSNSMKCEVPEDLGTEMKVMEQLGTINEVGPWKLLNLNGEEIIYVKMHGWWPNGRAGEQVDPWEAAPRVVGVLQSLGVEYAMGDASVGGIQDPKQEGCPLPPGAMVVPTDFRMEGVPPRPNFRPETDRIYRMGEPFCNSLRKILLNTARKHFGEHPGLNHNGLMLYDANKVQYVCTSWGRLETAAEIEACKQVGDHVVGMSIGHEAHWMRAVGINFAVIDAVVNHAESGKVDHWSPGTGASEDMANYYQEIAIPCGRMMVDAFSRLIEADANGSLDPCACSEYRLRKLDE